MGELVPTRGEMTGKGPQRLRVGMVQLAFEQPALLQQQVGALHHARKGFGYRPGLVDGQALAIVERALALVEGGGHDQREKPGEKRQRHPENQSAGADVP